MARRGLADQHDVAVGGGEPLRGAVQPPRVVAVAYSPVVAQPHEGDRAVTPEVDEVDPPLVVGQHDVGEPVCSRAAAGRRPRVPRAAEYLPLVRAPPLTADPW
jgi:hypothetical protein